MVFAVLLALTPPDVPPLLRDLGAASFAAREKAHKALIARGEVVLPAVRAAAVAAKDAEARHRAGRIEIAVLFAARTGRVSGVETVPFPAGEFHIGSSGREQLRWRIETQHAVRFRHPWLFGAYEVTQGEYRTATGTNPSYFCATGGGKDKVAGLDTDLFPVERVTWFDAVYYCNRLSVVDGFPEYYELADVKRDAEGIIDATVTRLGGPGYRLPTEAEWETSCRAGTTGRYNIAFGGNGKDGNFRPGQASGYGADPTWSALMRTAKVGSYPPNGRKAYDCHGNTAEWCWDRFDGTDYAGVKAAEPPTDPAGPDLGGQRAVRGGSWATVAETGCRSAARHGVAPWERRDYVGFRVTRSP